MYIFGPFLSLWGHGWGRLLLFLAVACACWAVCPIIRAELESLLPWLSPSEIQWILNNLPDTHCTSCFTGQPWEPLKIDRSCNTWQSLGQLQVGDKEELQLSFPCYLKILDCALSFTILNCKMISSLCWGRVLFGGYWLRTGKLGTWWAVEISWWLVLSWWTGVFPFLSHCPHVHRRGSADAEVDCCTVLYCLIRMSTVLTSFPIFRDNRYTVT